MMPNLFIPGAAKSGASSLHIYLDEVPDINMAVNKELHFLCCDWTPKEVQLYEKMSEEGITYNGESSTGYMLFEGVVERIKALNNSSKFIFLLRNPVDRFISYYNWLYGSGYENKSPLDAFYHDDNRSAMFKVDAN